MNFYNTTWIATVTGTGTTWTFSIVKEILSHHRLNVLPKTVYKTKQDYFKVYKESALPDCNSDNHYVLQCHAALALYLIKSRCKVITNVRNPYDNCASHYEFMKCDLGRAITNAKHIPLLINHYSKLDKEQKFLLRYEDIDEKPVDLIKRITEFLCFPLDEVMAQALADKYSRDNVKKMIADNEKALHAKVLAGKQVSSDEVVMTTGIDRIGSFDTETGYQSHHISKRKTGEWRSAFSQTEIPKIIEALAETAEKLGYQSETF